MKMELSEWCIFEKLHIHKFADTTKLGLQKT